MKPLKFVLSLSCLMMLSACSTSRLLVSTEPQQTIYSLRPIASTGETSSRAAKIIEILAPSVPPGLDRDRIALGLNDGQKLDYYATARWSASLDHMVEEFTRRSASAVLPYVVTVTPEQAIDPDYKLQLKVNEFQPVYEAGSDTVPMLKVGIEFTVIAFADDRIVSSFTLYKQEMAQDNRLDAVVSGLEKLLREIEREAFLKMDEKMNPAKIQR